VKALLLSAGARLVLVMVLCLVVGVRFERVLVSLAVAGAFALSFLLFRRAIVAPERSRTDSD
jgi:hypothetical protein